MQVSKPVTSRNKQEIRKIYNTGRTHKAYGVEINSKLFLKLLLKKDGSVMRDDLVLSSIAEGNLKCGHAYQFWITFQTSTPKFYFLLLASTQVENLVKIFYDHERSWMILSRSLSWKDLAKILASSYQDPVTILNKLMFARS